jgi:hypothetical protein
MKTLLLLGILGVATLFAAPVDPKKDAARKDSTRAEIKPAAKPEAARAKPQSPASRAPMHSVAPRPAMITA